MKLKKANPSFEEKILKWAGGEPEPEFTAKLNDVEKSYENWGRADATRGQALAHDKAFEFCGKLCFEDSAEMAEAMAEHIKKCYMDGYKSVKVSA